MTVGILKLDPLAVLGCSVATQTFFFSWTGMPEE